MMLACLCSTELRRGLQLNHQLLSFLIIWRKSDHPIEGLYCRVRIAEHAFAERKIVAGPGLRRIFLSHNAPELDCRR